MVSQGAYGYHKGRTRSLSLQGAYHKDNKGAYHKALRITKGRITRSARTRISQGAIQKERPT